MSIRYAILGLLSWKPATGYELKKVFEESSILYWSGNNNQIYKALLELQEEDWVVGETIQQESSPSKKRYSVTDEGVEALKQWMLSPSEAPVFKKPFLVQLAWSDMLSDQELDAMLSGYEDEIKRQLLMEEEKVRRARNVPDRTDREHTIWSMISENLLSTYRNELNWIQEVRSRLLTDYGVDMVGKLGYQVLGEERGRFVKVTSSTSPLRSEEDALDLVALCGEQDSNRLLISYEVLSEDFFNLKNNAARDFTQKLVNYRIRTGLLLPLDMEMKGGVKKMAKGESKGSYFRIFSDPEEAVGWLLADGR